jgi:hypothetical protein
MSCGIIDEAFDTVVLELSLELEHLEAALELAQNRLVVEVRVCSQGNGGRSSSFDVVDPGVIVQLRILPQSTFVLRRSEAKKRR